MSGGCIDDALKRVSQMKHLLLKLFGLEVLYNGQHKIAIKIDVFAYF